MCYSPASGAGRRTITSPRRSWSILSCRSSRLRRAWSSRRCHTCSSRSLSRPSARSVRRIWLISCTLGTSRSSRGDRCRDDRSPAAAQARTVFSLSPRIFAAITGRTLPSSARASWETASSFARRSSPSGSVLATSSMASTRSNRLRMRCSSVATDKGASLLRSDASDYQLDSRNPPLRNECCRSRGDEGSDRPRMARACGTRPNRPASRSAAGSAARPSCRRSQAARRTAPRRRTRCQD
jgi:hypothetical protein